MNRNAKREARSAKRIAGRFAPDASRSPCLVIGLVGGIGSGKSAVGRLLARKGARIIDCDRIVARLLDRPAIRRAARRAFGRGVLASGGRIDRRALADRVFPDPAALRRLERILHPPTLATVNRALAAARREKLPAAVIDAPLLLETGLSRRCDLLLFVDAPLAARRRRVTANRGWRPGELARREKMQWTLAKKRRMCDTVLPNRGSIPELSRHVEKLWSARVAWMNPPRRKAHV